MVAKKKTTKIAIVNQVESPIARESDQVIELMAGPEISVASTKAFTAQCLCLILLAIKFAETLKTDTAENIKKSISKLLDIPTVLEQILANNQYKSVADLLHTARLIIFIGRGKAYPLALEGALKFKEITYISSEGIPAGELKHGPISLIESSVPVVAIAPFDELFLKTLSNLNEIKARDGKIIMLSTVQGYKESGDIIDHFLEVPACNDSPFEILLYTIPMRWLWVEI
jgi:glutamine---fructose-6-phosphate transaminase (isomerizing)